MVKQMKTTKKHPKTKILRGRNYVLYRKGFKTRLNAEDHLSDNQDVWIDRSKNPTIQKKIHICKEGSTWSIYFAPNR